MEDRDRDDRPGVEQLFWWESSSAPQPDWRVLFDEGGVREILRRLVEGDPLDLLVFCEIRLWNQAILLEPERLFARAAAMLAHGAHSYGGHTELVDYVTSVVDRSTENLLDEDRESERMGQPIHPADLDGFRRLVPKATGIEIHHTRRAAIAFNALEEGERCEFYHIVVGGMTVEEYAEEMSMKCEEIVASIERATMRMVRAADSDRFPYTEDGSTPSDPDDSGFKSGFKQSGGRP